MKKFLLATKMNYHLDRKNKKQKYIKYALGIVFLAMFVLFQNSIFRILSSAGQYVFRPVLILGDNIGAKVYDLGVYFKSKKALQEENRSLLARAYEQEAFTVNYNTLYADNLELKEILNRKQDSMKLMLSAVLGEPNSSLYNTMLIDTGSKDGIEVGQRVLAWGDIPIGTIAEVYSRTAKVLLYSSPGEATEVILEGSNASMKLVGRGAGNFEMILPRDFDLKANTQVVLPGFRSLVVAQVDTVISDPRDSFKKALLTVPINIFELKFVEIEI